MKRAIPPLGVIIIAVTIVSCATQSLGQEFRGTSLSPDTPLYGSPPYLYDGNQVLTITFQTTHEALRSLVPEPLIPNSEGLMLLGVGRLCVVDPPFGSYNEAFFAIPVQLANERDGIYMPVLYVDSDWPILGGRELYGFNKLGGQVTWTIKGDQFRATVNRANKTIIEVAATLEAPIAPPQARLLMKQSATASNVCRLRKRVSRPFLNSWLQLMPTTDGSHRLAPPERPSSSADLLRILSTGFQS